MSAMASNIYKDLVAQGVDESRARAYAEHLDAQSAGVLQRVMERLDQAVAGLREHSDAKYVGKDEYHARDRELVTRSEFRAWMITLITLLAPVLASVLAAAVRVVFFGA